MAKRKRLIELNENDDQIVAELAAMNGDSWIVALRQIIREWARTAPITGKTITIGGASQPEKEN